MKTSPVGEVVFQNRGEVLIRALDPTHGRTKWAREPNGFLLPHGASTGWE